MSAPKGYSDMKILEILGKEGWFDKRKIGW
jgi:hypothetical protein